MNRLFAILLLLITTVSAFAAGPTLENFDPQHFRTNAPAPHLIRTRLSSQNFDQSGDTWSITNVAGATGSTHWTNRSGVLYTAPGYAEFGVTITNLVTELGFTANGSFAISGIQLVTLSAGVNSLNPTGDAVLAIDGSSADPEDSQIVLGTGNGFGSFLWIENRTGNGFFITNNTPITGNPTKVIRLINGDFYSQTQGEMLWLRSDFFGDWVEQDRKNPQGGGSTNIYQTLITTNLTVEQNITVKGNGSIILNENTYITINGTNVGTMNPTIGRLPYKATTNTFGDSPWFRHATNIVGFGVDTNQFIWQRDAFTMAIGFQAGGDRTIMANNVAIGGLAMEHADGQFQSVAVGNYALQNQGGSDNVAIGHKAMQAVNQTVATAFGANNVAVGFQAMTGITNGHNNVAIGASALTDIGNGIDNAAVGTSAGDNFSGSRATFLGHQAGFFSTQTSLTNVGAIGYNVRVTNINDFVLGNSSNNIIIPGTLTIAGTQTNLGAVSYPAGITAGASTFTGAVGFADGTAAAPSIGWTSDADGTGTGLYRSAANNVDFTVNGTRVFNLSGSSIFIPVDALPLVFGASGDTIIRRDGAANTLALRNGANAQTFNIYNTYTDASNYERLSILADPYGGTGFSLVLQTAGTGAGTGHPYYIANDGAGANSSVIFRTAAGNRWQITSAGHLLATTDNSWDIGASGATRPRSIFAGTAVTSPLYGFGSSSLISAPSDGLILFRNNAGTDFNRLQFGGTTASFPALKRSGTTIQVRVADDTADADLSAEDITVSGNVGTTLSVGDTTFVNLAKASQTNSVSGALTFAHATNGVHGSELTHVRWFFVPSGGPHTLTIPSGWRTNVYSAVPPALTNGTITAMYVKSGGPTADAASQTNCYVSFEYYK